MNIYVQNHDLYGAVRRAYNFFALAYFGFFAWRSWTVRLVGEGATGD